MLRRIGAIAAVVTIGATTAVVATVLGTSGASAGGNTPRTAAVADFSAGPVTQDLETSSVGSTSSVVWIGAPTTGVPDGTALRVIDGDVKVTTAGTVLDGVDIRGQVFVMAPNVVIRNSIIRGKATGSNGGLVQASYAQGTNLLIEDSEIAASYRHTGVNGVMGGQFTLRRVNIHDVVDPVHIYGDNVTVEDSWLHDNVYMDRDPNRNYTPTHDDSIQIQKGVNIRILDNFITGAHNAAVQTTQDQGPIGNLEIRGNYIDNGGCMLNLADKGKGAMANVVVAGNTFGLNSTYSRCSVVLLGGSAVPNMSDNWFTDGMQATWRRV